MLEKFTDQGVISNAFDTSSSTMSGTMKFIIDV